MPSWVVIILTLCGIWFIFIVWSQWNFGSYSFALDYLRGSRLQVHTPVRRVGVHRPDEKFDMAVRITNHGDASATIVGALTDCSCLAMQSLPRPIAPGETVALPVRVHFGPQPGDWRQHVTYLTDDSRQPRLDVELVGRVEGH